jgi:Predicted membrane protein (DUF2232)
MAQIILVGLGAGAASALLLASVASGTYLSIALFYLAPLPILIAALGWSHLAGLLAATVASASLWIISGRPFIAAPAIAIGAWWLGYLALLARPATNDEGREWYPVGRLVLWAAAIGALVVAVMIPGLGTDRESLHGALRRAFARIVREHPVVDLDLLVVLVPPMAAAFSTIVNLLNLWLAAKLVKISGRLARPWPQLSTMAFPSTSVALLAAAAAASLLPDLPGILSGSLAASLLTAYAILGFAVVHVVTQGMAARPFVLGTLYAAIPLIYGLPLLAMSVLGLAETLFNVRDRISRRGGQPPART